MSTAAANQIGVVYLARAQNGTEPFKAFLDSYARCPAGMEHELLIVLKGFKDHAAATTYLEPAKKFAPKVLFMRDFGFDLRGYGLAFRNFDHAFFCVFNSFSELLHPDWLRHLHQNITKNGVGLAGATGSAESMYSNVLRERAANPNLPALKRAQLALRTMACQMAFDPFPNYHIRTTGFMIARDVARKIWPPQFLTKRNAYLFENGKNSLTKRIRHQGLRALVVGKDGTAFEMTDWYRSKTFRQAEQENLLFSDNQTRLYQNANEATRRQLKIAAWGEPADRP